MDKFIKVLLRMVKVRVITESRKHEKCMLQDRPLNDNRGRTRL